MARKGRAREQKPIIRRGRAVAGQIIAVSTATQTNTALAIGHKRTITLGIATQTDEARLFSTGTLGRALQTNTAIALTRNKLKTLGIASQTNTAIALKRIRVVNEVEQISSALTVIPTTPPPQPGNPNIWRVDLYGLNAGTVLLSDVQVQSWMFSHVLNAPGAFESDIQLNHVQAIESNFLAGAREIRVLRGNDLVWGGYLWAIQASATDYKMRLRGEGYFSRLRRRIIADDLVKKDKDQADIAWELIQYTQNTHGSFNLTDGHVPTGIEIDHAYCATDLGEVGAAIEELSEMDDSFDFWITPTITDASNKVFKNASPRRGTTKAFTINQDNALSADYEIDASDLANRIWGIGNGDCNPPEFEATASSSITTYGELHDVIQFDDLDHLPSVKAHTREEIRLRKQPRRQVTVRLEERDYTWGSYDVGDIITLASNRGFLNESRQMRVLRIQFNFEPENRIAFIEMDLDSVTA